MWSFWAFYAFIINQPWIKLGNSKNQDSTVSTLNWQFWVFIAIKPINYDKFQILQHTLQTAFIKWFIMSSILVDLFPSLILETFGRSTEKKHEWLKQKIFFVKEPNTKNYLPEDYKNNILFYRSTTIRCACVVVVGIYVCGLYKLPPSRTLASTVLMVWKFSWQSQCHGANNKIDKKIKGNRFWQSEVLKSERNKKTNLSNFNERLNKKENNENFTKDFQKCADTCAFQSF